MPVWYKLGWHWNGKAIMKTKPRINYKADRATDNYIKMCKKAKEIQKLRKYNEGGWFYTRHGYHRISDDYIYFITDEDVNDNWITRINGIWLPTQEQLQGMIVDPILNIAEFSKWALKAIENAEYYMQFDSWNELWLAFVMKEKYDKIWNKKDWISIGTTDKTNQKI